VRIRQIKPEFFRDRLLAEMSADVREFYIGLWMQADDSGWLRWAPGELGADLYPYRGVAKRERSIEEWGKRLSDRGRIVIHDCGHAFLPTLTKHQRFSGVTKQVHTFHREHSDCTRGSPRGVDDIPQIPAHPRPVRNGTLSEGTGGEGGSEENREQAVANLRAMLDDPKASEQQKKAARKGLEQMGYAA
jgi:hypothetical protein